MARVRPSRLAAAVAVLVAAVLAVATPPPAAADELHIRSVAGVRLPLETSIRLRLNIRGTTQVGVRARLNAAIAAFEGGITRIGLDLERGAVKRESTEVAFRRFRDLKCVGGACPRGGSGRGRRRARRREQEVCAHGTAGERGIETDLPTSLLCCFLCAVVVVRVVPVVGLLPVGPAAVGPLWMQRSSKWSGEAQYTILVPAKDIFTVLRLADSTNQNVVGYVRDTAMRA